MRRTRVLHVVLLVSLVVVLVGGRAGVASAGVNVWSSHGPESGQIRVVAIDPATPTALYAAARDSGVFKTANGGENWSPTSLTNIDVQALAIDPATPTTLYAGTYGRGVFKSTNGGATWAIFNSGLTDTNVRALVIDPATPSTLYAGTFGGVFKSTNGGGYWFEASTSLTITDVQAVAIDPLTPSTLYAGTERGGVFKSTNGGGNWSAVNTGVTNLDVQALAIDPATPTTLYAGTWGGGVFKSTDGGANWFAVNSGLANMGVSCVAIDPATPTTLYANGGGLFKSTNGGGDWSPVNTGLTNTDVRAVAIDPATPATLYAGTGAGVFRSTNRGANWNGVNTGLVATLVNALAIDPGTPATLYAGTEGGGIFKSSNGGGNWTAINAGLTNPNVNALVIDPLTPTTVYAGTAWGGVFKSTNSGGNWSPVNTGLTNTDVQVLAIDPVTPLTLYAGTWLDGGVFKSANGGESWSLVSTGLPNASMNALAIDPATPSTVYAATGVGVFKSTNGGGNWSPINTGLTNTDVQALAIDPAKLLAGCGSDRATPTTLYAGTWPNGVFKTTNGGGNWSLIGLTTTFVHALAIDPATPATLYAGTWWGGGVFKSTNGGSNWTAVNTGLPGLSVQTLAIDPGTPTKLHAGTWGGGVFDLQQVHAIYLPLICKGAILAPARVTIKLWEQEGDTIDTGILDPLVAEFVAANPSITVERTHYGNEELRTQFQTAALAGHAPELLRGPNDPIGVFADMGIVLPIQDMFDQAFLDTFLPGALAGGVRKGVMYAIPDVYGNHLMLLYNKNLVSKVPADWDELITTAKGLTNQAAGTWGLVMNSREPFWLAAFLGGYGGSALDPVTDYPVLNTPAMVKTLQFLGDLTNVHRIVPPGCDYNVADTLFKEGKAAFLVNGDWSLSGYTEARVNYGTAAMPPIKETGLYPTPMTSGKYWVISSQMHRGTAKFEAVKKFVEFMAGEHAQQMWLVWNKQLPSNKNVANSPIIQSDPVLRGSMAQLMHGVGMPTAPELRCFWDSVRPGLEGVIDATTTPAAAAARMQADADRCMQGSRE